MKHLIKLVNKAFWACSKLQDKHPSKSTLHALDRLCEALRLLKGEVQP